MPVERARQRLAHAPAQLGRQIDRRIAAALGELGRPAHDYAKRLAIKGDGRVILVDVSRSTTTKSPGSRRYRAAFDMR